MEEPDPPPPPWRIGNLTTVWVEYDLIRPHLRPGVEPTAAGQATVVRVEDFIARKCDPEDVGAFTIVKWNWAEAKAPAAFGVPGLGLQQRGNAGIAIEPRSYRMQRDPGSVWLPTAHIPGCDANVLGAVRKGAIMYATVNDDGINITSRKATDTRASVFVEATYMVSRFHEMVAPVNAFLAPAARQPRLPWYLHGDRRVVSPIVVRRLLVEERIQGVLRNMYKVPDDTTACEGVFTTSFAQVARGRFVTINKKNSLSVPIIPLAEVLAHPALARWAEIAGPGLSELPIVLSNHPPNTGSTGGSKARQAGDVTVSVKSTLTKRLKGREHDTRKALEEAAHYVSCASRFGSYLLNLHYMRMLEEGHGTFPAECDVFDTLFVTHAMHFVREGAPPENASRALRASYEAYSEDLATLKVPCIYGLSNAVKADAKMYVTSVINSIHQHGSGRLAGLISGAMKLEGVWRKGAVRPVVMAIESGYDFPASGALPDSVKQLIAKYRKLYLSKGLDGRFGFAINDTSGKARQHKFHRVLEIYWEIEKDMDVLERRAQTAGWSVSIVEDDEERPDELDIDCEEAPVAEASTAPPKLKKQRFWKRAPRGLLAVNRLQQRYIRIDEECWRRHLWARLCDLGLEDCDQGDMMSMFVEGGTYRTDIRKLRSKGKGYRHGITVCSNGTGLITNYANARKDRSSGCLRSDYVPDARDRVIGVDPGRVNIMTCCVTMERDADLPREDVGVDREAASFMTLTRAQYYEESGVDALAIKTEARKLTSSKAAHEALSQTRRRTVKTAEFLKYVRCVGEHRAALHATYNSRNALGDQFRVYEGKLRTKDRFITGFGTHADVTAEGRLIVAMGDGSFSSSGRGERAVPTAALEKRLVHAHRARFDTVSVGEHNTTQACSQCYELTSECHRRKVVDGVERWVKDRDVRRCNSPLCLESPHPCAAAPRLLVGLREWDAGEGGVYIDRDHNPSLTMARLCGLENHERPAIFQRRDPVPV